MPLCGSGSVILISLAIASMFSGCASYSEDETAYTAEKHYDRACSSASRSIDVLMVHWENARSGDRMPAQQVTQARQAMAVIAPLCKKTSAAETLDTSTKARLDAAFYTLDQMARNLPRLPAGG